MSAIGDVRKSGAHVLCTLRFSKRAFEIKHKMYRRPVRGLVWPKGFQEV